MKVIILVYIILLLHHSCHSIQVDVFQKNPSVYPIYGTNCTNNPLICGSNFICNNGTCGDCNIDYDCYFFPTFQCKEKQILVHQPSTSNSSQQYISKNVQMCLVKGFWIPTVYDVFATIICFVASTLAAASGIGGGIMYVPVLLVLGRFLFEQAVPISGCIILGTSLPNLFVLLWKRHPHANKPLINYEITILVFPILTMGVTLGVILNIVLPSWLQAVFLIGFMLISIYRTARRGLVIYRRERKIGELLSKLFQNKAPIPVEPTVASTINPTESPSVVETTSSTAEASNQISEPSPEQQQTPTQQDSVYSESDAQEANISPENRAQSIIAHIMEPKHDTDLEENYIDHNLLHFKPLLQQLKQGAGLSFAKEKIQQLFFYLLSQYPIIIWFLLATCWLLVFLHGLAKGGMTLNSIFQIEKCSTAYWLITASIYPILFIIWICIAIAMRIIYYIRVKKGYQFIVGDVRFTNTNTFVLPLAFFASGISGSLLGVGTGILSSPLLEEFGLLSQVSMATSAFLIFFTSSTTVSLFMINGNLKWDYAIWFFLIGFISTLFGRYLVGYVVKKFKIVSWIIFLIVATIFVMIIAVIVSGIYHLLFEIATDTYITFKNPCGRVFE